MFEEISNSIRINILDILVIVGIYNILNNIWQLLESVFDGKVQSSITDTIFACIITWIIWSCIRKWYIGGDIKNDL